MVSALIEDVVEVARRLAAASPGVRLDPPLGLVLDEAANYPLPSLPALMSEGGGTGIMTIAVLQSLAQALGDYTTTERSRSWQAGQSDASYSESRRERPILDPSMIRRLPRGLGLLMLRSARPIVIRMAPWGERDDAASIEAARDRIQVHIAARATREYALDAGLPADA